MLAIRYTHKNCFLHPGKIFFYFLEARWPADMRFWSTQEAFLRRPTWLQKAFEALQSASKHQLEVTNLCFGSILFKKRFFNDVSNENPIFVLSGIGLEPFCMLQEAFVRLPRGYWEAFKTLQSTFKHLQDVTPVFLCNRSLSNVNFWRGVKRVWRGVKRVPLWETSKVVIPHSTSLKNACHSIYP